MRRTFLALGDSYTVGAGVPESARWPNRLASFLHDRGHDLGAPEVIARTGWTCAELDEALTNCNPIGNRELVSLMIGVNDQYRGYPQAAYAVEFDRLLERAIALAGGAHERTLVLSIPDWGLSPFAHAKARDTAAIAADIDVRNATARACCLRRRVPFVDITESTRVLSSPASWAADDLHPGPSIHEHWARTVLPIALSQLAR